MKVYTKIAPEPRRTCFLGIDCGATFTKSVVMRDGRWEEQPEFETPRTSGLGGFCHALNDHIQKTSKSISAKDEKLYGVGIGLPGVVDQKGQISGIDNLPFLDGVYIEDLLFEDTKAGVPCYLVDNDSYFMAKAEWSIGAGEKLKNVIFATIGTGIGGAMVLNGDFYRGEGKFGGEFGNMFVTCGDQDEELSRSNRFEALASVSALVAYYKKLSIDAGIDADRLVSIDGRMIVEGYRANEPIAQKALDWHVNQLSGGISSLINIFNPKRIVLGGGMVSSGEFYIEKIRQRVARLVRSKSLIGTEIMPAALGNVAGGIGAALAVRASFTQKVQS